ncbi:MAG TPA: phosphotransferase family protein [Pseudonocardiaceae bacterium]|nr:phosphotransferase family protein [Pseudonocardiaceae bacterium]
MTELPGLDTDRLDAYLATALPGLVTGPLSAELVVGGRSNLTYYVTDGATRWVLRRPPLGHVLRTAHDMGREFRVLSALAKTTVPVPATIHLCADPEPIGAPFYLMEYVPGVVIRSKAVCEDTLTPAGTTAVVEQLVDVLAELHGVDADSVGLGDFGRPEGYLHRQVRRWRTQLDASRSRDVAGIDELHDRLAASVPVSRRTGLVHGDYRLDNVIVDPAALAIAGVLDWEMATLGDPLADVGLFVVYTRARSPEDQLITGDVVASAGFPPSDTLVARYAERTGADLSDLAWYVGLACFKLAVVLEGIHYRFTQGKTVGAGFDEIGARVPGLVGEGLAALTGEESL